jgi:hypothetical protein
MKEHYGSLGAPDGGASSETRGLPETVELFEGLGVEPVVFKNSADRPRPFRLS